MKYKGYCLSSSGAVAIVYPIHANTANKVAAAPSTVNLSIVIPHSDANRK
jgi:hypothetical protein